MSYVIVLFVVLIGILSSTTSVFAENDVGSIELEVRYHSGDMVSGSDSTLKIFQDHNKTPFREIFEIPEFPFVIDSLPLDHKYKIEVYRNTMLAGIRYISLNQFENSLTIPIVSTSGMRFQVFYNDNYTPINNAEVRVKSYDGSEIGIRKTGFDGKTRPLWIAPTLIPGQYYIAEISGEGLVHVTDPLQLSVRHGVFKVVTTWPPIIQRIEIHVYENLDKKIVNLKDNLDAVFYDSQNEKVAQSPISSIGESYFTLMKPGEYTLSIINKTANPNNEFAEIIRNKVILTGSIQPVKIYLNGDVQNNLQKINLNQKESDFNCNCVAFRLDDVQDNRLREAQISIINLFKEKNAYLTIGIIGGVFGKDQDIVEEIKTGIYLYNQTLKVANHSWNNNDLTYKTKENQLDFINKTNNKIFQVLGVTPSVFIPPLNMYDKNTLEVINSLNFTHISFHEHSDKKIFLENSNLQQFPASTQTASLSEDESFWILEPNEKIRKEVHESINENGYAVIMMHPMEFSLYENGYYQNKVNQKQIEQLGLLIDQLRADGLNTMPISHIDSFEKPIKKIINPKNLNCNCVAFRLDNVQDSYLNNVQIAIMNTFEENNADLTIGLFGKAIGGDPKITEYIKNKLKNTHTQISLANRGWEYTEYADLDKSEQSENIRVTGEKIYEVFGVYPDIFIPASSTINQDTISVLDENNIKYFSTFRSLDPQLFDLNVEPIRLPSIVSVADLIDENSLSKKYPSFEIKSIMESEKKYGFSVISLRSQDFAVFDGTSYINEPDKEKLSQLDILLKNLHDHKFKLVTIDKITQEKNSNTKNWSSYLDIWYSEGKISLQELNIAKNFLSKKI